MAYISEIAQLADVHIKTIRYYEEVGLLPKPKRTASGYRLYETDTVDRLIFIKKAQSLGLQLKDVKEILDLSDRGKCPCGHVQQVLKHRLEELREKLNSLQLLEHRLTTAIRHGCPSGFRPKGKAICPTIEKQRFVRKKRN